MNLSGRSAWPVHLAARVLLALTGLLSACAGGDGIGSSGTGIGTVGGFGSVVIDGRHYDESGTRVTIAADPTAPSDANASALRVGMQVEFTFDGADRALTIRVRPEVTGSVETVDADGFVVAGQRVSLSGTGAVTGILEGFESLADIVPGDRVEVHGLRDAAATIPATRIERLDPDGSGTRVAGPVSAIAAGGTRFRVGSLDIVPATGARVVAADGGAIDVSQIAVGDRIAAWSGATPAAGTLLAGGIRRQPTTPSTEGPLRVSGIATTLTSTRFAVAGVVVDAAGATFSGGSAQDLATGRFVRVRGTAAAGILRATEVSFGDAPSAALTSVAGVIGDFFSASRLRVRGVPVDASGSGVAFVDGDVSNLADGALVIVDGTMSARGLVASRVRFVTTPDDRTQALLGTASGVQTGATAFTVLGVTVRPTDGARFSRSDGGTATRADLVDGSRVLVRGGFQSGAFVATDVVLTLSDADRPLHVAGVAYHVDVTDRRLRIGLVEVRWTAATLIDGDIARLRAGRVIQVEGKAIGGLLVATRLTIR